MSQKYEKLKTLLLWRMDKSEMRKRHVVFQEDKDSYVRTMLEDAGV